MNNNYSNFPLVNGLPQTPAGNVSTTPTLASIFPQPNGNVYILNTTNEMGNIPTTPGVTAGICLGENTLTIKSFQNGAPAQITYKLVPMNEEVEDLTEILKSHKTKIESLERQIQAVKDKVGGKLEWQI